MNTALEQITVRQALLAADGQVVRVGAKRWKIEARETTAIYPYAHVAFRCVAQDLDPANERESLYCVVDLIQSDSEESGLVFRKAIEAGCKVANARI